MAIAKTAADLSKGVAASTTEAKAQAEAQTQAKVLAKEYINREEWLKLILPAVITENSNAKKSPTELVNRAKAFLVVLDRDGLD